MKFTPISYVPLLLLTACGNPGGISDADYAEYKELSAPKFLYTCTVDARFSAAGLKVMQKCLQIDDLPKQFECMDQFEDEIPIVITNYIARVGGGSTYNKMLIEAKEECENIGDGATIGELEILDSEK